MNGDKTVMEEVVLQCLRGRKILMKGAAAEKFCRGGEELGL